MEGRGKQENGKSKTIESNPRALESWNHWYSFGPGRFNS